MSATVHPNATANLAIESAELAPDLSRFVAQVAGSGAGSIAAGLSYNRHNYADLAVLPPTLSLGLACHVDWSESITVDATIDPFSKPLTFDISMRNVDAILVLDFVLAADDILYADFSPPPLVALFGGKPQVTLNCPLAMLGSLIAGAAEAVFTEEQARQVLPLITGKQFPAEIKRDNVRFEIEIEPITLCLPSDKECTAPVLTLAPAHAEKAIVFEAD